MSSGVWRSLGSARTLNSWKQANDYQHAQEFSGDFGGDNLTIVTKGAFGCSRFFQNGHWLGKFASARTAQAWRRCQKRRGRCMPGSIMPRSPGRFVRIAVLDVDN